VLCLPDLSQYPWMTLTMTVSVSDSGSDYDDVEEADVHVSTPVQCYGMGVYG
jgi:hypothetical protein